METRPAIIGIGAVKAGRYPDRTETDLALEAVCLALADAGIGKERVQAVFATPDLRPTIGLHVNRLCEYLRLDTRVAAETTCGAVAPGLAIRFAVNEILLGHIEVAVCYGAEREGSTGWYKTIGSGGGSELFEPCALQAYGTRGVVWAYALAARRYMHETGATEEHFAMAAVRNRRHAAASPWAAFTRPISVEDVLRSPPLCTPIKLLDAPVSLDGAAAVVVASAEVARRVCERPVHIAGIGQFHDASTIVPTDGCDRPISTFVSTRRAAEEAFERAGVGPEEIDVAELYAPFSPFELVVPEDIGWFERGGMVAALERGDTGVGGRLPINTDGGLLSRGHPWGVTGFYETIAVTRQLRGEAGDNQVPEARTGLVHLEAGMLNDTLIMILRRDG
jgi:acetyl-CoA acetyltransferase